MTESVTTATARLGLGSTAALALTALGLAIAVVCIGVVFVLRRRAARRLGNLATALSTDDFAALAAEPTPTPSDSSEHLGEYRLVDRIGEGGMAEIWSAVSERPDGPRGPLVIKRMRHELNDDPLAVAHFVEEGKIASALLHPNIVSVLGFGELDGCHYLAQEYVRGRDAGALTRRMVALKQRPLSATAILYLAHEVLAALEYAHDRRGAGAPVGIVHSDITPENILVSTRGEVKLLDFGIARCGREGAESVVKGNVEFMSPEQARGAALDRRSDLFSLGLVMYYCAARAPLYRMKGKPGTTTTYDRLLRAATGPGRPELEFIAGLAPPLSSILPRVLAVDPAARFQSARQMREAIAPHVSGGGGELSAAVQRLFGEAVAREEQRLTEASARVERPRRRGAEARTRRVVEPV